GDVTTGINEISNNTPTTYFLSQNWPNPFNPSTKIRIEVPKTGPVKLTVYNVLGQLVATLVNGQLSAGSYEYELTATETSRMASGIYFYRLETPGFTKTMKMLLMK
ncbi:MAG: T9SS type A sorting domain-containing protein, partial [Patescibacteria group bacterium]